MVRRYLLLVILLAATTTLSYAGITGILAGKITDKSGYQLLVQPSKLLVQLAVDIPKQMVSTPSSTSTQVRTTCG